MTGAPPPKAADTEAHPVDVFGDWISASERQLRIQICAFRDEALDCVWRSKKGRVKSIYSLGSLLAADWAFWPAATEELQEVLDALTLIFMACRKLERLEGPDVE